MSTLFRYFTGKADIVRYDALDPLLFDAYGRQPADLSPIVGTARREPRDARRPASRGVERAAAARPDHPGDPRAAGRRPRRHGHHARAASSPRRRSTRTGREPDPFAVEVLVGALGGAITAAMRSAPGDDMEEILDRDAHAARAGAAGMSDDLGPRDRDHGPDQGVQADGRGRRADAPRRACRDLRLPRPQRRRQVHDDPDAPGHDPPDARRGTGARGADLARRAAAHGRRWATSSTPGAPTRT